MKRLKLFSLLVLLMTAVTGAWAQGPSGAIDGKFTINADGDLVYFAKGNLQATYNGSAWSWAFATNQWDIIGNEAANTSIDGDGTISGTGTVDLFGWVGENSAFTGTAIYGISNSTTANQFGNTKSEALKSDWGNTIGTGWRTLTIDEWDYVLNTRTTTSGVSYAKATVNGIVGLILLPDDWSTGYYTLASTNTIDAAFTSNEISSTDWTNSLEAHGAVFLPAGGYRNNGTTITNPNVQGFYWSATSSSSNALQARRLMFQDIGINLSSGTVRYRGHSVRLVYNAPADPTPDFAGEGTEVSPYLIATADDWNLLATRVSEGNTYSGEYFQLTNDIAISTMVGLSDHNFNGTFDGAGNTITATLSSDAACCAPFAYTYGATIKNLHTTGTITTTGDNAGGVVGRNGTESLTLTNVSSDMTINSTKANGGLVGYTINATISGCAFTGKLLSESSRRIGGFVGWKSNTTGSYLTITDCVFDPAEVTNGNSSSKTFAAYGGGTVTITNCYYTQAVSADQGKLMHAITAGEGVTVANAGTIGILYNGVLYGGNEEAISLTLSGSDYGYIASTGVLSGDANPYTLTMADAACEIQAAPAPAAPDFVNVTPNADPQHAGVYYSTFYFGSAKYKLPAEVEAYAATRGEGVLNLTKIADAGQTIPAGTAVILKATSDNFTLTLSDEAPVTVGANDLEGTDVQKATPANCYVLAGNDGVGFYHYTASMLNEHKAYVIYAPNSGNAPKRMPFIFDAATGIENGELLNGANGVQKVIRDGQLIIIKDGVEYNAQGQIVK